MKEDLALTTERIDDFVVLLAIMQQMDLPGLFDRHIPRHWLQQGLSWGWTATIWLAHIVLARRPPEIDGARLGATSP